MYSRPHRLLVLLLHSRWTLNEWCYCDDDDGDNNKIHDVGSKHIRIFYSSGGSVAQPLTKWVEALKARLYTRRKEKEVDGGGRGSSCRRRRLCIFVFNPATAEASSSFHKLYLTWTNSTELRYISHLLPSSTNLPLIRVLYFLIIIIKPGSSQSW